MRYEDGLPHATNLFEAAAWHKALCVTCSCGHSATFDPHGLWWLFERKGWNMRLADARRHFICSACNNAGRMGMRAARIEAVGGTGSIRLPMPDEREWKSALSRFR